MNVPHEMAKAELLEHPEITDSVRALSWPSLYHANPIVRAAPVPVAPCALYLDGVPTTNRNGALGVWIKQKPRRQQAAPDIGPSQIQSLRLRVQRLVIDSPNCGVSPVELHCHVARALPNRPTRLQAAARDGQPQAVVVWNAPCFHWKCSCRSALHQRGRCSLFDTSDSSCHNSAMRRISVVHSIEGLARL